MYIINPCDKWTGLCNQLFAIANGILHKPAPVDTIYIANFSPEINSSKKIAISSVLDLQQTSKNLGITLLEYAQNCTYRSNFGWYPKDPAKFNNILQNIVFQPVFYPKMVHPVLNVVHLRIENDAIKHWSRQNKMPPEEFSARLLDVYRKAITDNIPSGEPIMVLTFDKQHAFLAELAVKWNICTNQYDAQGREVHAIYDLLAGEQCNGVFVGCHNFTLQRGSTFSYTLWQRMKNVRVGVFIDLDDIKRDLTRL